MAEKRKISCLRMEPATNGVIISYDVRKPAPTKNTYDNSTYEYPKEVFDFDGDDKEAEFEKAFDRFKELWKEAHMS